MNNELFTSRSNILKHFEVNYFLSSFATNTQTTPSPLPANRVDVHAIEMLDVFWVETIAVELQKNHRDALSKAQSVNYSTIEQ